MPSPATISRPCRGTGTLATLRMWTLSVRIRAGAPICNTASSTHSPRSGSRLDSKSGLARFEPSAGCHQCRRATRSKQSADNRPTRKRSSRFDSCCGNHPGELSGIGIAPAPKADWPSAPRVWEFKSPTRRQIHCPHSLMDQSPRLRNWMLSPFKSGWGYQSGDQVAACLPFIPWTRSPTAEAARC